MKILTIDNTVFPLNDIPDINDDQLQVRYAILDNNDPDNPDFFFHPLTHLESFDSPAIVLTIGEYEIAMPLYWCIAVGDSSSSRDIEMLPMKSLNDRGFEALLINPLTGFMLEFAPVEVISFYNEVRWYFPKMKRNHILCMPLSTDTNPPCAYFVKEVTRHSELIRLDRLL